MAQLTLCRIGPSDIGAVSRLLDTDVVQNVYLRSELRLGLGAGTWWGVSDGDEFRAAILAGSLIVPWIADPDDVSRLAEAIHASTPPRMLVGDQRSVLALHQTLEKSWPAQAIRNPQPVLVLERSGVENVSPITPLRKGTRADLDLLTVAAAAMHREEMGVDPLSIDSEGWRLRMTHLVDRGWSWVWMNGSEIAFKAELSAWTREAVQIQGVYTAPHLRGRGVATMALRHMCSDLLRDSERVTLYVNDYNQTALDVYGRVGFQQYSNFATVIY